MKRLSLILATALIAAALAACGSDSSTTTPTSTQPSSASATPTSGATVTPTSNTATPTSGATANPTSTQGQVGTPAADAPEGTDSFTLIIESGDGAGEYTGFYDDATALCLDGGPGPYDLFYIGPDQNNTDKFIQLSVIGSEDEPDATIVNITISEGNTKYIYHVAPMQSEGSAPLSLEKGDTLVATVEGTSAEGPQFDITAECHESALLDGGAA